MILHAGRYRLDLGRPKVMGIVNITPDSFSDGGRFLARDAAVAQATRLVEEGADLIDIGGESTRPGAAPASLAEELERVIPVCEALVPLGVPVSVDTQKPEVMTAAIAAGAAMINDVNALRAEGAIAACAAADVAVCLMHMQGEPRTMQQAPHYEDVVQEVKEFLRERATACLSAGIARERIVLDPGFGFGKSVAHNFALLGHLDELAARAFPVLAGWSRKSSLGAITGRPVGERLPASLAAAVLALEKGARILRVHDVRETVDAVKVWCAMRDNAT